MIHPLKAKFMKRKTCFRATGLLAFFALCISTHAQKQNLGVFDGYTNVGNPKLTGSFLYDPDTQICSISGGGANIWFATDQFFYVWKKVSGDCSLTARVDFEGKGVVEHRKTGIMIRQSLSADARYADVAVHGDGLTSLQYRPEEGALTQEIAGPAGGNYITLEKRGNVIRMKTATGAFPRQVTGEIELNFTGTFYIGIFICSHDTDVLETARFSRIEFKQ
jgi:hypothetical protein